MSEEKWQDKLPEELRDAPYLGKAESVADALGKLQHAAKLVGTSVRIPDENASDSDREAFLAKLGEVDGVARMPLSDDAEGLKALMAKLGTPEEGTDYKLPELEDFTWGEETAAALREYALEAGMTVSQFTKMAAKVAAKEQDATALTSQAGEDLRKEIRLDWGDTLEDREALIRGWMDKSTAPESLRAQFEDRNLDLPTMNWLHGIAKQFKGDVSPISKDGSGGDTPLDPGEAQAAMTGVLNDLTGMREDNPQYKPLQAKLVKLQRLASGSRAA
ncbi:MAG: hypothetical protein DRH08_06650 [Deltaproteobacteria bacterium]|nr:MAG: hypothetical protein DRH08_06650 [Deltaproteobacteria bacterium]